MKKPILAGLLASTLFAAPAAAQQTLAANDAASQAWPYMTESQRTIVDVVARDLYRFETTPQDRQRMLGRADIAWDQLPEGFKAPFRGIALRQLGHTPADFRRKAV